MNNGIAVHHFTVTAEGGPGAGKTHFLSMVEKIAAVSGCLTRFSDREELQLVRASRHVDPECPPDVVHLQNSRANEVDWDAMFAMPVEDERLILARTLDALEDVRDYIVDRLDAGNPVPNTKSLLTVLDTVLRELG